MPRLDCPVTTPDKSMPFFDEDEELEGEFTYEDSPLFVEWVKSGKSWKDLLEKHRGKIAGSRYGL